MPIDPAPSDGSAPITLCPTEIHDGSRRNAAASVLLPRLSPRTPPALVTPTARSLAAIRTRIATGAYGAPEVLRQVALRMLRCGALDRAGGGRRADGP